MNLSQELETLIRMRGAHGASQDELRTLNAVLARLHDVERPPLYQGVLLGLSADLTTTRVLRVRLRKKGYTGGLELKGHLHKHIQAGRIEKIELPADHPERNRQTTFGYSLTVAGEDWLDARGGQ